MAGPLEVVSVSLTVTDAPTVDRLYFWALQTDFLDSHGRPAGGAHLGLQWHPAYPGRTAVNWGGYRHGGGELAGSESPLPSAAGNLNTRNYRWEPGRTYRLTVRAVGAGEAPLDPAPTGQMRAWRATVTDTGGGAQSSDGTETVIRDLHVPAASVGGVTVWSEVFARCDDRATMVLWSDPKATRPNGETVVPVRTNVNYQSDRDGGCANTNSAPTDAPLAGIAQSTNTRRETTQGSVIAWP
ncbi:MAG: hypothetical protein ACR2OH_01820 [Microthrixaceae bacterium]